MEVLSGLSVRCVAWRLRLFLQEPGLQWQALPGAGLDVLWDEDVVATGFGCGVDHAFGGQRLSASAYLGAW